MAEGKSSTISRKPLKPSHKLKQKNHRPTFSPTAHLQNQPYRQCFWAIMSGREGLNCGMFTIKNKNIFADDGTFLKAIDCPQNVKSSSLAQASDHEFHCNNCNKTVIETDLLSEQEITQLLREAPDTCLKISRFDPLFRFEP